jgi:proteic killer suppression protein
MIRSFRCPETRLVFDGYRSRKFPPDIQSAALVRLMRLHAAQSLNDLRVVRGDRLHQLTGDRAGQWAIRINDRVPTEGGWCVSASPGTTARKTWRLSTITRKRTMERLEIPYPGITLREAMEERDLTAYKLAKATGISEPTLSRILSGDQAITAPTALKLASFFETSPEFWLNLQMAYDLMKARRQTEDQVAA